MDVGRFQTWERGKGQGQVHDHRARSLKMKGRQSMKITKEWLKKKGACPDGFDWFCGQQETDSTLLIQKLMAEEQFDYANWLISELMSPHQCQSYSIYAAELVLPIFEKEYPDDAGPREAIESARRCLDFPTEENRIAAETANEAAYWAAEAAYWAADSAAEVAKKEIQEKIINYGIKLLKEVKK